MIACGVIVPPAFTPFDDIDVLKAFNVTELVTHLHTEVIEYHVAVCRHLISTQFVKVRHVAAQDSLKTLVFIVPYKNLLPLLSHVENNRELASIAFILITYFVILFPFYLLHVTILQIDIFLY